MHEPNLHVRIIRFGPFELDTRSGELRNGSRRLRVPDQSIEILKALLEHPGELVTRDQLRERLWSSDTFVDFEHGLNAAVRRLRESIGDSADAPTFIETLPRRGYRFIAPAERIRVSVDAEGTADVQARPVSTPASPAHGSTERTSGVNTGTHLGWLLPIGLLAIVLAVGFWIGRTYRDQKPSPLLSSRSTPVTSLPGAEADPALSPDGSRVAFAWDRDTGDNFDIFVKLVDTGDPQPLTSNPAAERAPAWSPDGGRIAFLRATSTGASAYVVPAVGGQERRVAATQVSPENGQVRSSGLSWTPDGTGLLLVDLGASRNSSIFVCSIETDQRHQLTSPPSGFSDTAPAISPDGRTLGFVRRSRSYNLGRVFVQTLDGLRPVGEPRPVTDDPQTGSFAWTHDSRSVIYEVGDMGLMRRPIAGGQPQQVVAEVRSTQPSVDRDGKRLVYQATSTDANIWRAPGPAAWTPGGQLTGERIVESTFFDMSPQLSRDGSKLAFVSMRSGTFEIWVSESDGSKPTRLTSIGGRFLGSPRWSPDRRFIAFDSTRSGSWNIDVVGMEDGRVHSVTSDSFTNVRPSWSSDGRWIYFGSKRDGTDQIWKIDSSGGEPQQVTRKGGFEGFESADSQYLYYVKPAGTEGVWRVPVDGGAEVQVIDHGRQTSWSITDDGIALLDHSGEHPLRTIEFFGFSSRRPIIASLPAGVRLALPRYPHLSVSHDGRWMWYVNYDQWGSDIHMLQGSW